MKAARLYGKYDIRLEEVPIPELEAGDILLKVKAAALCGTDIRMYRNGAAGIDEEHPKIIGHEISGVIEAVGTDVTAYAKGMKASVAPNMGCGVCDACVSGNTHLCGEYQALGINIDGGFAEYVRVPAKAVSQGNVSVLSDEITFEEASVVEPLSCVLNGQEQAGIHAGDKVLIIGAGPIGMMHAMLAKMQGAGVILMNDLSKERLQACKEIDDSIVVIEESDVKAAVMELTGNKGVDVCIVACPSPEAQSLAVELVGLFGRVLFFGGLPKDRELVAINSNLIHYKQISLHGSTRANVRQYRKVLEYAESRRLLLDDLITSTYALEDIGQAMENAGNARGMKHVIVF